ncbi:MAG: hypothetical protein L6311_09265 [Cellulomonas sp.]|nr:hypothetical protein [Cellulomonas sp.]
MRPTEVLALVTVGLAVLGWMLWVSASRLDRLHRKVVSSRAVVDAQLVRRATVAAELAASGLLDPVSSVVLSESSWGALTAATAPLPPELAIPLPDRDDRDPATTLDRARAESELTAALSEVLADPGEVEALRAEPVGAELLDSLAAAWYRVQLSRRFHNEAVAQAQRVRASWRVRLFRLAGHAPRPVTMELDDAWPDALDGYGSG